MPKKIKPDAGNLGLNAEKNAIGIHYETYYVTREQAFGMRISSRWLSLIRHPYVFYLWQWLFFVEDSMRLLHFEIKLLWEISTNDAVNSAASYERLEQSN
jgi:hypothetical protein